LAWLGLAWFSIIHSFIQRSPHQETTIKKEETMPDCLAMMPRGPGTTPLGRNRFPAALNPTATPALAATTHAYL
jgi:hypothetical protein